MKLATVMSGSEIQAQLQEYLISKGINSLFVNIVESLLIEKPDNPIQFIVDYLQKNYPDSVASSTQPTGFNTFLLKMAFIT